MSLVNLAELLKPANEQKYAVGAFDVFSIEMASAVIRAAEETKSPVILAYVEAFDTLVSMESYVAFLRRLAEDASVPVCIHLDHATNLEIIQRAVRCGFSSVMIDASDKSFEENIAATAEVVGICKPLGISVESELGHVSGNEGMYADDTGVYTEVESAKEFVDRTGVDALAVAIGTIHGVYKSTPVLSFDRCAQIKSATNNLPLVIHGGSGLSDEDFRKVIAAGINKVNIFTDLTIAAMEYLTSDEITNKTHYFSASMQVTEVIKQATIAKLQRFGCIGKAV
ncbi:MAG: class II fructose-bisphosphate aldolase [Anaerolineaceae bacterium]|jgi:fructose-bisphosphate aldolase class II|nr:class II fructose-bisphosphate aldolase [Anaerolineaceae bacterium]MDI9531006.1 class II fructose-bisphosphate aldolase [Chloroflexota bacterium]NLE92660.1 class II fructose-bisphosphate aldolase [Chloroflexota bacterium]HOF27761.1 class II fructose-bisphosphate aldolase [Anaerolineaceae bacterium]